MAALAADLEAMARGVLEACAAGKQTLATAESCTGGLIAAALTAIPGSSAWIERGFVTYSNAAKAEMLGVPMEMIERFGAVSEPVARAMAEGALAHSRAILSVSVTGIAGPGGGSPEKPVGTVHIAAARQGQTTLHQRCRFPGDRDAVRHASALAAMRLLIERSAG